MREGAGVEAWNTPAEGLEQVEETDTSVKVDPYEDQDWYSHKHPDAVQIARIDHTMALSLCGSGFYDEAHDLVLKSLECMRVIHLTDAHPDVIAVMNTRGLVEGYLCDYEASLATFNDILKFRSRVYGTSDPAFALGTNNYGAAMFMLDDMALAGRTWTESIELRERQVSLGSKAVSTSLYNMNALFVRSEKFEVGAPFAKGRGEVEKLLDILYSEPVTNSVPSMDLLLRRRPVEGSEEKE